MLSDWATQVPLKNQGTYKYGFYIKYLGCILDYCEVLFNVVIQ